MSADLNEAIDRAVREMLDVEPPANLRARVIARIDDRPAAGFELPASRFRRFGVLRVGLVITAAAALVLMVLLVRRAEPPAQRSVVARTGTVSPSSSTAHAQPSERAPLAHAPVTVI